MTGVVRWLRSSGDMCVYVNNPAPKAAGVPSVLRALAPRSRVPSIPALSAQVQSLPNIGLRRSNSFSRLYSDSAGRKIPNKKLSASAPRPFTGPV